MRVDTQNMSAKIGPHSPLIRASPSGWQRNATLKLTSAGLSKSLGAADLCQLKEHIHLNENSLFNGVNPPVYSRIQIHPHLLRRTRMLTTIVFEHESLTLPLKILSTCRRRNQPYHFPEMAFVASSYVESIL